MAVSNHVWGFHAWRLDADEHWRVVGDSAVYNPNDVSAQLTTFEGHLYTWTTHFASGQVVLQTTCAHRLADFYYPAKLTLLISGILFAVLLVPLLESRRKQV